MMNRSEYFNYIEDKLAHLATRVELRGKLNILDLHMHSENFYMHFVNKLYSWQLENANTAIKQNVEAIDLIGTATKIVAQVSATATKHKIESTLCKDCSNYSGYYFKFVSISKDASDLRNKTYDNPHELIFTPSTDIHDIKSILNTIVVLDIARQQQIYEFIRQELGQEVDQAKVETNLAKLINILALENWDTSAGDYQTKSFEIERKIDHNNLSSSKELINDFAVHHNRLDKIYQEFNRSANNKSNSVLNTIRNIYLRNVNIKSDDELFFHVIEQVIRRILESTNYDPIAFEELEMCVNILVVDAFIRCKIFKNPEGYSYATS